MIKSSLKLIFIILFGVTISGLNVDHCCSGLEELSHNESHECHSGSKDDKKEENKNDKKEHCKLDCCHQIVSTFRLSFIVFYFQTKSYHFINTSKTDPKNIQHILYRPPIA